LQESRYVLPSLDIARKVALAMDALWPHMQHWPIAVDGASDPEADSMCANTADLIVAQEIVSNAY
jgi:hypothetical protein